MHHGQEIKSFFYNYGINGILGIVVANFIITIIIYKCMILSKENKVNTYNEFLEKVINIKFVKNIIKLIINLFLISSFYIMVAGASTYFCQEFNINRLVISTFFCMICYITLTKRSKVIFKINTVLIPIIILIILIIGMKNIRNVPQNINFKISLNLKWLISAFLYSSYNSITLIGLNCLLSQKLLNKKEIINNCICINIILLLLFLIIYLLLFSVETTLELPLLQIAVKFGNFYKILYSLMIISAIYTTAISDGYSVIENLNINNKYIILIFCLIGVPISFLGFTNLINTVYPIFGIINLIQIFYILRKG